MNIRIFGTKCPVRGKAYVTALLAATLLAISPARLSATPLPAGYGIGSETNPWLFETNYYSLYLETYSGVTGYFFNDTSGYYKTGSSVDVSGETYPSIYVGYSNKINRLTIDDGYTVKDVTGYVGYQSGGGGTVLVTGSGSTWTNTGNLYIGYQGTGELDVASGGAVSSAYLYLGYENAGTGTLNITSGTVSASQNCSIGHSSTGSGGVIVNGISASLTVTCLANRFGLRSSLAGRNGNPL